MSMVIEKSQVGHALSEVIGRERQEEASLTHIGSWVIGASAVIGIAATSGAVALDRPSLLVAATAASVIGMMSGLKQWFRATDRREEVQTIQAFTKDWKELYTDHHDSQNFVRTIH